MYARTWGEHTILVYKYTFALVYEHDCVLELARVEVHCEVMGDGWYGGRKVRVIMLAPTLGQMRENSRRRQMPSLRSEKLVTFLLAFLLAHCSSSLLPTGVCTRVGFVFMTYGARALPVCCTPSLGFVSFKLQRLNFPNFAWRLAIESQNYPSEMKFRNSGPMHS